MLCKRRPSTHLSNYGNRETEAALLVSWPNPTMLRRCHLSFVSSLRTRLERISTLPQHVSFYSAGSSAPLLAALSFLLPEIGW